jgi:hypothetical protein
MSSRVWGASLDGPNFQKKYKVQFDFSLGQDGGHLELLALLLRFLFFCISMKAWLTTVVCPVSRVRAVI